MLPFLDHGETVYHERRKEVVVRAWPRMTSIPAQHDPSFEMWALAQLQLFKPFRTMDELRTLSIAEVFLQHLASSGFPNLRQEEEDAAVEEDAESDADIGPIEPPPLEHGLRQDDYQQIMNCGHVDGVTGLCSACVNWTSSILGQPTGRVFHSIICFRGYPTQKHRPNFPLHLSFLFHAWLYRSSSAPHST